MDSENISQQLQNKVDAVKTLSLVSNSHNLSPPSKRESDDETQIAIIKALSSEPRLIEIYLEAQGLVWDSKENKPIRVTDGYLNAKGAYKLVAECKKIARESEWSNFEEDKIPAYLDHFFREIYPYFTFWHDEYGLDPSNFDYVKVTLQMFLLGSFYKAKNAKLLNTLTKTYSEDLLGKALDLNKDKNQTGGLLEKYNPFRKIQ